MRPPETSVISARRACPEETENVVPPTVSSLEPPVMMRQASALSLRLSRTASSTVTVAAWMVFAIRKEEFGFRRVACVSNAADGRHQRLSRRAEPRGLSIMLRSLGFLYHVTVSIRGMCERDVKG